MDSLRVKSAIAKEPDEPAVFIGKAANIILSISSEKTTAQDMRDAQIEGQFID